MTPKKSLQRSNGKRNGEDCENDASLACSSGKNSRRKSSVKRQQYFTEDGNFDQSFLKNDGNGSSCRNLFDSVSKKASSTLRCLQENDMDGVTGNAPRKSN